MRITPACAGNSEGSASFDGSAKDHPRVCGEQRTTGRRNPQEVGSPPRVRGTEKSQAFARRDFRITPACAGNSRSIRLSWCCWQDHPRVCGEQETLVCQPPKGKGSPPRVRGTEDSLFLLLLITRITPACAGNSTHGLHMGEKVADHPRVCGEQTPPPVMVWLVLGSPPRVRGTVPPHGQAGL